MAKPPRIFDEELGKRDDDHKLRIKPNRKMAWYNPQGPLRRLRRKRMAIAILALLCIFLFIKNLPEGVERKSMRPVYTHPSDTNKSKGRPPPRMGDVTEVGGKPTKQAAGKKPAPTRAGNGGQGVMSEEDQFWYDGPIRFQALRSSLMATSKLGGNRWVNKNVMFAASNLKSAATLLPVACEMARQKKNDVHFAFIGRESMSMEDIQEINGVDPTCEVWMHDARPDRNFERTTGSMELSVHAAMGHLRNYIHPQAVIVDSAEHETKWFAHNTKVRSKELGFTLIELPKRSDESLRWLTRLDSSSLNAYNKVSINILIHAQPSGSGSILRLLHSLARADYFESTPPHISIELPHTLDEDLANHLQSFRWPPGSTHSEDSRLTLQRRIPNKILSADESAVRFLEGFWPTDARNSHVLVLSPQVELSPLYYHYLKYTLLDYKYSSATRMPNSKEAKIKDKVLGISLSLPSTYLNDSTAFIPPQHKSGASGIDGDSTGPSFLWTAPNIEAALYFGDKWTELHNFVSLSLAVPGEQKAAKRISTTYPSWLEYILSFTLARGSAMIYPQLASGASLATVHNELYTPLEEFSVAQKDLEGHIGEDEFTADPSHLSLKHSEAPVAHGSLLDVMDGGGTLPIKEMPILSLDGRTITGTELLEEAEAFSSTFRTEVGGCSKQSIAGAGLGDAPLEYLFCTDGEKTVPVQPKPETALPIPTLIDLDPLAPTAKPEAGLPRKSQTGKNPAKALAEAEARTAVSSAALATPTSKAAAAAKALEDERLGAGVVAGTGEDGVVADTRYASTPEDAVREVSQVKKAQEVAAVVEVVAPVQPPKGTRFDIAPEHEDSAAVENGEVEQPAKPKTEDGAGIGEAKVEGMVTEELGKVSEPRIENGQVVDEDKRAWLRERWQVNNPS